MADKAISELINAEVITATDMFVLEQNGTAKQLTGQVLLNWLTAAADGHGGISSIAKVGTEGLVDTYRITLADTTIFDFMVSNGRGINSINKTSTSGLVDTYTIAYNDGTSSAFTVTNGAKGDQGDNTYTWIKYASQEPTEASHSFGDLPDSWIGIYWGSEDTAPTDYTKYQWYNIKGDKGDTGAPATLVSSVVSYQASDSGTVTPSGSWYSNVPTVDQGQYLWTRVVTTFNTGNPIVSYSVARMGRDGEGAVATVAGVGPDPTGNIPVTAADVGARPDTWVPTASEVGARPDTWMPTAEEVGARPSNWLPTPVEIGAMNYIASITTGSCDDILVPLTLRDIRTNNDELYNMFATGGTKSNNYAYIITLFWSNVNADASRVQIAVGYTYADIATRAYYKTTGWKPWNMMMSGILHPYFYGDTLPSPGTPGRIFFLTS